jgi:hypothetical protein
MKALTTRVGTYVTSDDVADAVAEYALALSKEQRVDAVELPFVTDDGRDGRVRLTIGWGAELDVVSHQQPSSEIPDPVVIADIRSRAQTLRATGDAPLNRDEAANLRQLGDW